jgi:predicted PurR-regulated permease PerM
MMVSQPARTASASTPDAAAPALTPAERRKAAADAGKGPPSDAGPASLQVASTQPPATPMTMVLIGGAVVAALYYGREVFIPLALAILLSFALSPIASRLRRLGLGRVPSVLIVVVLALTFVSAFAWLLFSQAMSLAADLPRYEYNLRQKVRILHDDAAGTGVIERTADFLRRVGEEAQENAATGGTGGPARSSTVPPGEEVPRPVQPVPVEIHEPPETPFQAARDVFHLVAGPLAGIGIMLLFMIFVLVQREDLRDRVIRLFGSRDVHRATEAMSDAGKRIGRYLLMQLLVNLTFGALFGLGLWLMGVPTPLLWGMIGSVLRFVPYVGAPISMLFPLVISLAVDNGWGMPLMVVGLFLSIEAVLAYGLEPLIYGSSTGLSPAALVVATAFWTVLWGPVGLLLATPLTACLVVIGRHVPQLAFLEVIFGNREVLPPPVRFYQRLLADDPQEALEVAEEHGRDKRTTTVLDEVVLPALGLLEMDRQRGVIARDRLGTLAQEIIELVEDLVEAEAGPRGRTGSILCLGTRGSLDEAGAFILACGLREFGHDAVLAPTVGLGLRPEDLPREGIRLLCVSRVHIAGVAQVRRLVRRLRARYGPELPILIGLWSGEMPASEQAELADNLGATRLVTSLEQAIAAASELLGVPKPPPAATEDAKEPATAPAAALVPSG